MHDPALGHVIKLSDVWRNIEADDDESKCQDKQSRFEGLVDPNVIMEFNAVQYKCHNSCYHYCQTVSP